MMFSDRLSGLLASLTSETARPPSASPLRPDRASSWQLPHRECWPRALGLHHPPRWASARVDHIESLRVVLRHPLAVSVQPAEVGLRVGIALIGGFAEPMAGLGEICATPWPSAYIHPRVAVRGIPLIGGLAKAIEGLHEVLRQPLAFAYIAPRLYCAWAFP